MPRRWRCGEAGQDVEQQRGVGDVAGHGVRAAVTMGRLRTAIQTLAMLELPPAETLQQMNELMQELGAR